MNEHTNKPSPLVEAALALEEELQRIAAIASAARQLPLDSQQNLAFTAEKMRELGIVDKKLQPLVAALLGAVNEIVGAQQAQAVAIKARAEELQNRRAVFQNLMASYGSLAHTAQDLYGLVRAFADARQNDGSIPSGNAPSLYVIQQAVSQLIEGTGQIFQAAKQENFKDMAYQVDTLYRQLATARDKLNLLATSHGNGKSNISH
jgi:hypothetical protein